MIADATRCHPCKLLLELCKLLLWKSCPQRIHVGNLLRRICELDIHKLFHKLGRIRFESRTTPRRKAPFAVTQFNGDVLLRNRVQHGCCLTDCVETRNCLAWPMIQLQPSGRTTQPGEPPQPLASNEVQIRCPYLCARPPYTQSHTRCEV